MTAVYPALQTYTLTLLFGLQLPVYMPSDAEKRDPRLYADNVRQFMVRTAGATADGWHVTGFHDAVHYG